ncbi:GNAT family N-acetyltransferase [Streptomyces fulvoviolaceus]|uniref:GNAT family N-acetyltransferase n=1 Tax=Streptomyces fulvoviolaceus TaxID=285535 RepID=UPI0021C1F252|nr:GNAT family N-acetyltransferase [Streptomyces fulvoviolaceus]MCT9082695.1 acetyltransferase [Streptomyces fulvoviolaceus]
MSPTDASANAGTAPIADIGSDPSPGTSENSTNTGVGLGACSEDTLELRLPEELLALFEEERAGTGGEQHQAEGTAQLSSATSAGDDLLDRVADWGPTATPAGVFHLVPVCVERDVPLVGRWMNDPAVAAFWELAGPQNATEEHLRAQLTGDGRSVPCLGVLEGTPMSYWEIYRADLDPLARRYPARPHDTGVHLLVGGITDRGRGLGSTLLRAVADLVLDKRSACTRVVAEPDLRNIPSVAAFLSAGFRFSAEVDLPAKRAALMVRDRSLRDLL